MFKVKFSLNTSLHRHIYNSYSINICQLLPELSHPGLIFSQEQEMLTFKSFKAVFLKRVGKLGLNIVAQEI